ncbi:MAG TPA: TrbC/VirB2 family protein [Caulobacteraceae bacterium]|nr:TrbC/VirB2 family protein [Caulobacteraceae bacterium]
MSPFPAFRLGDRFRRLTAAPLALFVALSLAAPAIAGTTSGTAMPWETPLETVQESLSGPVAKAVGIIAIVVTALGFAFSEGGSALRKGIGIVFGLAVAFTATTFITSFFSVTSGAVW